MTGPGLVRGTFVERLNRFVSVVRIDGVESKVYVPNTGRLAELAIPGETVLLVPSHGKYPYKLLYYYFDERPVLIDAVAGNGIFLDLAMRGLAPEFSGLSFVRSEPVHGNHRLDFLFRDGRGDEVNVELKSCTLAWKGVASFPDAVSSRASEHVELLARQGKGTLVFFILHEGVRIFVPNYHTDFVFYETLRRHSGKLRILAYSVRYGNGMEIIALDPVQVLLPRVKPAGYFIIIFRHEGGGELRGGYYVLTGYDESDVFRRIARIKKGRKTGRESVDAMIYSMKAVADVPIVGEGVQDIAATGLVSSLGGIPANGDPDVPVYYFTENPVTDRRFWNAVLEMRYGRYRD